MDFTSINFADRASVLGAAKTFEDLGVSAYNGAGKLLTRSRQPAHRRQDRLGRGPSRGRDPRPSGTEIERPGSFAGRRYGGPRTGWRPGADPTDVLTAADPYVTTTMTRRHLPTT